MVRGGRVNRERGEKAWPAGLSWIGITTQTQVLDQIPSSSPRDSWCSVRPRGSERWGGLPSDVSDRVGFRFLDLEGRPGGWIRWKQERISCFLWCCVCVPAVGGEKGISFCVSPYPEESIKPPEIRWVSPAKNLLWQQHPENLPENTHNVPELAASGRA